MSAYGWPNGVTVHGERQPAAPYYIGRGYSYGPYG